MGKVNGVTVNTKMEAELMSRIEASAEQLRSRAEDLYVEDKYPDGDFMNEIAVLLDEITLPSHPEHTRDV
jgi:hypothetical protein